MGGHGRQKNVTISHLVDPDTRLHEARKKFIVSNTFIMFPFIKKVGVKKYLCLFYIITFFLTF